MEDNFSKQLDKVNLPKNTDSLKKIYPFLVSNTKNEDKMELETHQFQISPSSPKAFLKYKAAGSPSPRSSSSTSTINSDTLNKTMINPWQGGIITPTFNQLRKYKGHLNKIANKYGKRPAVGK